MADDLLQMFQSITTADHDELVDQFAHLLQLDVNTATFFLESSNWNVETAVNNYLSTIDMPAFFQPDADSDHVQRDPNPTQRHTDDDDLDMDTDQASTTAQALSVGEFQAQFVTDLSQAQTTVLPPNATVNMQLSFVNTGASPWPLDAHLVFAQGDRFEGPQELPVAGVAPGARIDVPVSLRMPTQSGSFAGSWQLLSSRGAFGDPVWLIFNVAGDKHDSFQPVTPHVTSATVGGGSNNDADDMMDL